MQQDKDSQAISIIFKIHFNILIELKYKHELNFIVGCFFASNLAVEMDFVVQTALDFLVGREEGFLEGLFV